MHDNNRAKRRVTKNTNTEQRKERLKKYKFEPGVEKHCLNCDRCFMPIWENPTTRGRFNDPKLYAASLFCRIECEMQYIHETLRSNAAPRPVAHKFGKGDMDKGVAMTQGAKWRQNKKERENGTK